MSHKRQLVLLGIGHTNAHVVTEWSRHPIPDFELVCVSTDPIATYSGMLPAVLAGQYPVETMQIDLQRLVAGSDARLIVDQVVGLDLQQRELKFRNRDPLRFDLLSIGIGSRPAPPPKGVESDFCVGVKPMQSFIQRLDTVCDRLIQAATSQAHRVAIVGGGVASIEIAFCLDRRLRDRHPRQQWEFTIYTAGLQLEAGLNRQARRIVKRLLKRRRIAVKTGTRIQAVRGQMLEDDQGANHQADFTVWATHASPPPLLGELPLALESRGFIATRGTLQSLASPNIFAVGDCGTIVTERTADEEGEAKLGSTKVGTLSTQDQASLQHPETAPAPKAGVFAVRQSPFLWRNLQSRAAELSLETYRPQKRFLKLLNTGDDKAILEYGPIAYHGRASWLLKDKIDRGFIREFQS